MPLYLTESDVAALLTPADAVEVIDECFRRLAGGEIVNAPRRRLRLQEGALADMAASDLELGLAGGKLYAASPEGAAFVVCIFETHPPRLAGVLEADHLGRLRKFVYAHAIVFHLNHASSPRDHVAGSLARLEETIRSGKVRCARGLDQYLQSK